MAVDLSVVIPVHDEQDCIRPAALEILDCLDRSGLSYELIAVDNGSRDDSGRILDELASSHPRLTVVHQPRHQGYGGVLLDGWAVSSGEVVGFTCSDGEVPAESLLGLYGILRSSETGLCKGRRIGRRDGILRRIFAAAYRGLVGMMFRVAAADPNGYPVLMKRSVYESLRLFSRDWMINLNLMVSSMERGVVMAEVDVPHRPRLGGRSHVNVLITPVLFLIQMMNFRRRWNSR
ncbi:MAG TPA: glycosyltransferase family 2 protein [Elusimicrobiota bacterium]|nr:glycosyltransferase family 2 protein [Elusimicrobiota bacterium]